MRRVVYSVAMSLDGYIARPDHSFDWIPAEPAIDWSEFLGRFDTSLVGRTTYEVAPPSEHHPKRTFVFSRTLQSGDHPGVTIVREGAEALVAGLKQEPGKDIWLMGGGELFRSLYQAGLVDVVETAVVPVLLGEGRPMLPNVKRAARLALRRSHHYPSGITLLTYDILAETV